MSEERYRDEIFIDYESNGETKTIVDEEKALSILLKEEILFCNTRCFIGNCGKWSDQYESYLDYIKDIPKDKLQIESETIVLFVNCNDVFAWGCADAEHLTTDDIPNLYMLWKKWGHDGVTKWCCIKRNEKPQKPIADAMKKAGHWDDELEALSENYYDKKAKEGKSWFDRFR